MSNIFLVLFKLSIRASIIFVFVFFLQKIIKNFIAPKIKTFIWIVIIISLTLPITINSRISIYNYLNLNNSTTVIEISEKVNNTVSYDTVSSEYTNKDIETRDKWQEKIVKSKNTSKKSLLNMDFGLKAASLVWVLGIVCFSVMYIVQIKKLNFILKSQEQLKDKTYANILEEIKKKLNISRNIKLYKTDEFSTPAVTGILNIKILIPNYILHDISKKDFQYIMYHELTHLRKLDNIKNYLILIYKTIYWFNPLIHLMFKYMKKDMEISCDNLVLDHIGKEEKVNYGRSIVNVVEKLASKKENPIAVCLIEDKEEIMRRIIMIKNYKKFSKKISIAALAFTVLISYSAMSEPNKNYTLGLTEEKAYTDEVVKEVKNSTEENKDKIEIEKAQKYASGKSIEIEDIVFTIDEINIEEENQFRKAREGNQFLNINMIVENKGLKETQMTSIMVFKLFGKDGTCYNIVLPEGKDGINGLLPSGAKIKGKVCFEVPENIEDFQLGIKPSVMSEMKIIEINTEDKGNREREENKRYKEDKESKENKEEKEKEAVQYELSKSIEREGITFTIDGISITEKNQFKNAREGNQFLNINMTIENKGSKGTQMTSVMVFKLIGNDGRYYNIVLPEEKDSINGLLPSGGKIEGKVSFEVPQNLKEFELEIKPSIKSEVGTVKINLGSV